MSVVLILTGHKILKIILIAVAMKLSKQSQSRLEESKVEKRIEDEEYLTSHQEIAAAIRVISKVRNLRQSDESWFKK